MFCRPHTVFILTLIEKESMPILGGKSGKNVEMVCIYGAKW